MVHLKNLNEMYHENYSTAKKRNTWFPTHVFFNPMIYSDGKLGFYPNSMEYIATLQPKKMAIKDESLFE